LIIALIPEDNKIEFNFKLDGLKNAEVRNEFYGF
jgi:hypothetical protein